MMTSKIEEFILQASLDELITWMNDNPNLIYRHIDSLDNRLKNLTFDSSGENIAKCMSVLLLKNDKIESLDYRLIQRVCTNQLSVGIDKLNLDTMPYLSIVGLFAPVEMIVDGTNDMINPCLEQIYRDILDLYIPCDNPELLISLFKEEFSLKDLLSHNTEWFCNKYNSNNKLRSQFMLKEMILLYKHISDILYNDESRFGHIVKLHGYYKRTILYRVMLNDIEKRYVKYFKDDTRLIITELIDMAISNEIDDDTHTFLVDWSSKYSTRANNSIINCLIGEVKKLISTISPEEIEKISVLDNAGKVLLEKWGNPLYEVEPSINPFDELTEDDKPITYLSSIATEALHKDSVAIHEGEKKIYRAYKNYKEAEEKVDSQITKALNGIKGVLVGDVKSEIIEGKKFSAIGLLKRLLGTAALFSTGKIRAVIVLVTKYALKKKTTTSERRKIIMELETEIELIDEKINDAKGDGNRDAKYAMMRTKKDLEHALNRIKYGMEADVASTDKAKQLINQSRGGL